MKNCTYTINIQLLYKYYSTNNAENSNKYALPIVTIYKRRVD